MRRAFVLATAAILVAGTATADVQISEHHALKDSLKAGGQTSGNRTGTGQPPGRTGEQTLIDASGLQYFINTDITFSTSSSASGAASEASYTAAVNADTSGGGTVASTLNDAFDGQGARCVSLTGATGPCQSGAIVLQGVPDYVMYNQNGVATLECNGRQVVTPPQTIGQFTVQRKIFVPVADEFIRWMDIITNNGAAGSLNLITSNNLGSDTNTALVTSSDGDATAEATDLWITNFQAFTGSTSSDVRLGHVLQGAGAPVPVAGISFVDGDDNPFWHYTVGLNAGQTRIILNYVTGQESRAAAAAAAAAIAGSPSTECMTDPEIAQVANFVFAPQPNALEIPTASTVGLLALGLLLSGAAFLVLRRR